MIARITWDKGWKRVRARRLGNFCLHRNGAFWTLTHTASGHYVQNILLHDEGIKLAKVLNALPVDWRFRESKGPRWEKVKAVMVPVLRAFLRDNLSLLWKGKA